MVQFRPGVYHIIVVLSCCVSYVVLYTINNRVSGAHQSLNHSSCRYTTAAVVTKNSPHKHVSSAALVAVFCFSCVLSRLLSTQTRDNIVFCEHPTTTVPRVSSKVSLFFCLLACSANNNQARPSRTPLHTLALLCSTSSPACGRPGGANTHTHTPTAVLLARECSHVWAKRATWTRLGRCWIS